MPKLRFRDLGVFPHPVHVHTTQLHGGQTTQRHTHDFFEAMLVTQGSGCHHINRHKTAMREGNLIIVRPEDFHFFSTHGDESLRFINVAVSAFWWRGFHQILAPSFAAGWEKKGRPRGHVQVPPLLRERLAGAFQRITRVQAGEPLYLAETWRRVAGIFMGADGDCVHAPSWLVDWRRRLDRATPEEWAQPIRFWQRLSGRTPEHLARSCRLHYRATPSDLLNQVRLEYAKQQLRGTDEKVITIAFASGFNNMAHFHRLFARTVGQTPGAWRKSPSSAVPL